MLGFVANLESATMFAKTQIDVSSFAKAHPSAQHAVKSPSMQPSIFDLRSAPIFEGMQRVGVQHLVVV